VSPLGKREEMNSNTVNNNNFDKKTVNIKLLKTFASEKLSHNSILRSILLSEKERLTIPEFLAKTEIWIKLLRNEER
jgi:hypothetical protein